MCHVIFLFFFFFNDTATTEIYTLSLHDALPIFNDNAAYIYEVQCTGEDVIGCVDTKRGILCRWIRIDLEKGPVRRSEEHTSELQSRQYLVCRLLLEKKKKTKKEQNIFVIF